MSKIAKGALEACKAKIGLPYAEVKSEITQAGGKIGGVIDELQKQNAELVEALEFECGNRCNAEYNPCSAREALKLNAERVK